MAGESRDEADDLPESLSGGLANVGAVTRRGVAVRRPAPGHAPAVHAHLDRLRAAGFHGAPAPRRLSPEGWEELEFIQGDVALVPYPWWSMSDKVLASVGRLVRRYHDAAAQVPLDDAVAWPRDLADPEGGSILCHNDVCIENVVFRDGEAAAVIDFDFAAPGRPVWDLASAARYWIPVLDPASAAVTGRDHLDPVRRLRVLVDAYGLGEADRGRFVDVLEQATEVGRAFVAARVGAGEPAFVSALAQHGGWDRWDRIQRWLVSNRQQFTEAVAG